VSAGLSQRKTTGTIAATPPIAIALMSPPAMYTANAAAMYDRAHDAAIAFACSIIFLLLVVLAIHQKMAHKLVGHNRQQMSVLPKLLI
jgi:hypothetical protein